MMINLDPPFFLSPRRVSGMGKIFSPLHKSARQGDRDPGSFSPPDEHDLRGAGKGRGKGGNINLLFPFFLTAAILLRNERRTVVVARSKSKKPPTDTAFFAPQGC